MVNKETTKIFGDFYVAASDDPTIYGVGNMTIDGDLDVLGNFNFSLNHSSLSNLSNDDHTQYLLLAGRAGGQAAIGGTDASDNLTITSTSNVTKGSIIFPETTISTSSSTGALKVSGGIGISNTTDSTSSTNGGTITTAGGLAVAKKGYFGSLLTAENGFTSTGGTTTLGASTITSTLSVTGVVTLNNLTASQVVFTNASKNLVSVATSGTGNVVLATSPTLVTPILGAATATSLNISGLTASQAVFTDASKNLVSIATTGTGNAVLATSPTLITPNIGAATATTLNTGAITGTSATFSSTLSVTGIVTLSNLSASQAVFTDASKNLVSVATTGTGNVVLATSPTLVTPTLGVATGTSLTLTGTTDATSSTVGGTLTNAGGAAIAKKLFVGDSASIANGLNMNSTLITNLLTPVSSTDAANKSYVDSLSKAKYAKVATTVPGTLSTSFANGSTIDGVTLVTGDRILIKNQVTGTENGIYTVNPSGSPTRATDFATGSSQTGTFIVVQLGTTNTGSGWIVVNSVGNDIVGTNSITFTQLVSPDSIIAGTGLTRSVNTLSVNASQTQITAVGTLTSLNVSGTVNLSTLTASQAVFTDASKNLISVATTGTGNVVLATSPTLVTPNIGAATATTLNTGTITGTSATFSTTLGVTGLATFSGGLTSTTGTTTLGATTIGAITGTSATFSSTLGVTGVVTLSNLTASQVVFTNASKNLVSVSTTGSGNAVLATSPTLVTPTLGVASGTSLALTGTTDATSSTIGGTFTNPGGAAIAKKLFVGDSVSIANGLNMNNTLITNLLTPVNATDAATKNYVDTVSQGLNTKQSVIAATVSPGTLASSFANGSTIDGITLATGDRILIKDQTSAIENGIYIVNVSGSPTRTTDFATGSSQGGSYVFVISGTVNDNNGFVVTNNKGADIVGTNGIVFTQFSGAGQIIAGTGLTKTGNTLSVNAAQTQITSVGTLSSLNVSGTVNLANLSASQAVFTDASKNLISVATTGTGNVVLATSPTLVTPNIGAASATTLSTGAITGTSATFSTTLGVTGLATFSGGLTSTAGTTTLGATTIGAITGTSATFSNTLGVTGVVTLSNLTASQAVFTDASKNLISVATTGTGNVVLATSPTLVTPILGIASGTSLNLTGTTDATSSTVGGTFTNAGGAAIAKKLFVGTDTNLATVSGITTIGSSTALTVSASGLLTVPNTTVSTSSSTGSVLVSGGIGISNTTDATDITNGGTFTTAGGATIGKQLFVGTRLSINGTQPTLDGGLRSRLFMTGPTTDSGTGPHIMATVDTSIYPIFHQLNYSRDVIALNFDMYYSGASYRLSETGITGFQMTKINNTLQFNYTTSGTTGNPVTLANGLAINSSGIVTVSSSLASTSNSTGALLVGGGIGIFNNTTDASSITNGGTFTTGGGAAIGKKLYVGTNIYLDGENTSLTVDLATNRRLGIIKKAGGGPFFAIGNASSFEFKVASGTNAVDNVATTTYTNLAILSNTGLFTLTSTTDATSSTSGGTFTNSGGAAIAKKLFVGTDVSLATVSGTTTIGSSTALTVSAAGILTVNNTNVSTSTTTGALIVAGGVGIAGALYASTATFTTITAPHGGLTGLLSDDHTQYALLAGRTGGQVLYGGTAASDSLTLRSTVSATKGSVLLDETTATTSSSTGALRVDGGIGISNTTDAISATNGGTFTTAGGAAIAKKLFVGTDVALATVSGNTTIGSSTALTVAATGVLTVPNTTATTSSTTGSILTSGGISSSNTTDSSSTTNGGSMTLAGGAAIAQQLHVGTRVNINGSQPTYAGSTLISRLFLTGTSGSASLGPHIMATVSTDTFPVYHQFNSAHNNITMNFDMYFDTSYRRSHTSPGYQIAKLSDLLSFRYTSGGTAGTIASLGTAFSINSSGVVNFPSTIASTDNITGNITLAGGIAISNTTDATSSTSGGTFTSAGGLAVAKKVFIGTDLSVGGTTLLSNYFQMVNITAPANPPASNIRFYTDTADSLLKSQNSAGIVTTYQPTTTKGDLVTHNGTTQTRLPVGANGEVLAADSTEATGLKWVPIAGNNIYYIYDQKTQGTNGGTATSGSWLERTLNTISAYPTGTTRVTLSGSNMIFTAGTYQISAYSPFSITNSNVAARLFNVTGNTVLLTSLSARTDNSDNAVTPCFIYGIITVTVTTTVSFQYFVSVTRATYGLGRASGLQVEKFGHVEIKVLV